MKLNTRKLSVVILAGSALSSLAAPALSQLTLRSAPSGASIQKIVDGQTIDLASTKSISAEAVPGSGVSSVVFKVDDIKARVENASPYSIAGDTNGSYRPWIGDMGRHAIKATPWSGDNGTGTYGTPVTVNVTIIDSTPFPARVGLSSDGNYHDKDDWTSIGMAFAQLTQKGKGDAFTYCGHSDHYWRTDTSWESEMQTSVDGATSRFGPFVRLNSFNARANTINAVNALAAQISASTATNRLGILGTGPMQVIGLAVAQSNPAARQYVTLYSHSPWNDTHAVAVGPGEGLTGTTYSFAGIGDLGVHLVHIPNQNPGLSRPYSEYSWMQNSPDANLRWLYGRGTTANKATFDCSDTGLTYYLLTGDPLCNPSKLKALFGQ